MSDIDSNCITLDSSPEKVSLSRIFKSPLSNVLEKRSSNVQCETQNVSNTGVVKDYITLDSDTEDLIPPLNDAKTSQTTIESHSKDCTVFNESPGKIFSTSQSNISASLNSENSSDCFIVDGTSSKQHQVFSTSFIKDHNTSSTNTVNRVLSAPSCSSVSSLSKAAPEKVDFFNLESSDTDEEQLSVETRVNDLLCSAAILDDIESGPSKCSTPLNTSTDKVDSAPRSGLFASSNPLQRSIIEDNPIIIDSPFYSASSVIQRPSIRTSPMHLKLTEFTHLSASTCEPTNQEHTLTFTPDKATSFSNTALPKKRFKRDYQINDLVAVSSDDENKCDPFPLMYRKDESISVQSENLFSRIPKEQSQNHVAHTSAITSLSWCIPRYSHLLLTASADSSLKIWDICHKKHVQYFKHSLALKAASWTLDGETIITGGYGCQAHVYDVLSGKHYASYSVYMPISCIAMHPSIEDVFLCGLENSILAFDLRVDTLLPIRTYVTECNEVLDIAFLNDKEFISSNSIVSRDSADRTIMVWDFHSGAILSNQIYQERYTCPSIKVHPSDTSFVAQSNGNYIASFSTDRPYKVRNKIYDKHKVSGYKIECDISPDGRILASGDLNGDVYFYDYFKTDLIHKFPIKSNVPTNRVKWHPVLSSTLAVSSWDGQLSILK